jgi:hypothetical protein
MTPFLTCSGSLANPDTGVSWDAVCTLNIWHGDPVPRQVTRRSATPASARASMREGQEATMHRGIILQLKSESNFSQLAPDGLSK